MKATSLNSVVKLQLSENIPCCLKYELGDNSWVSFYLASKVKDDDMDNEETHEFAEGGRGVGSRDDY